ncbi:hypothetical protein HK100_003336 [Physocladia obscura]|uniref:Uncharacterized protein n=1 Tax=Physocladia obscura TaxID=109957 RepID=A0AAD5XAI7_9FUNG|nr:hypothetical protein HK100_003336 [Physocladia obscura]
MKSKSILVSSDSEGENGSDGGIPLKIEQNAAHISPLTRIASDGAQLRPVIKNTRLQFFLHAAIPPSALVPHFLGPNAQIPAAINRYLRSYQRDGAQFIYSHYLRKRGGLLADDMGLGKTIQVISFLAAVLQKTGHPDEKLTRKQLHRKGQLHQSDPSIFRALIICPTSVMHNWERELDTWGYFTTGIFHGVSRRDTLVKAQEGLLEVVITSFATARNYHQELKSVPWSCMIVDEAHQLKESTSQTTKILKSFNHIPSHFGLTGTAIQNKYKDLWCILDFCNPGSVGSESAFNNSVAIPLKQGQAFDATKREIAEARRIATKFRDSVLSKFMLRRTKSLIAHQLPRKEDKIVFCPMSVTQRDAYMNVLRSPNFDLLVRKDERCDCFDAMMNLKLTRGKCCHGFTADGVPIGHTILKCLVTLQKISNHIALIMPDQADPPEKQEKDRNLVKVAFPASDADLRMTWLNMRNPEFCGKWRVLEKLLEIWRKLSSKVLLFSASVKLLNMLEILMSDKMYNYSRLDGKTPIADRMDIVDKFNNDPKQFVFLISTKAGGVGLNLTSANVVVIFDPNWNPAHDLQAQDRAFRIGQSRDVSVYRLIAAGSLEEVIYGRQVYKQQQANIGYNASAERRLFSGVQGDKKKKGELFGLENLLSVYSESDVITKLIINKLEKAETKFLIRGGNNSSAKKVEAVVDVEIVDMVVQESRATDENDVEALSGDEEDEDEISSRKKKRNKVLSSLIEDEETAMVLAGFQETPEETERAIQSKKERDAVSAILECHGIGYTHDNSDILGTSKAEKLIAEEALHAVEIGQYTQEPIFGFAPDDDLEDDTEMSDGALKIFLDAMAEFYKMGVTEFAELISLSSREEREKMLEKFRNSI